MKEKDSSQKFFIRFGLADLGSVSVSIFIEFSESIDRRDDESLNVILLLLSAFDQVRQSERKEEK